MSDQVSPAATPPASGVPRPLLERDAELAHVDRLLAATATGGGVMFISGDAGTGKSTLLEEIQHRAAGRMTVRSGRCDALTTPAPLAPLYDMRLTLPPEVVDPLLAGRRELLFAALLEELGRTRSVFLVDDVHWADEATIDLLRYLGRRIGQTRTLLVCAFRGGEVDPRHPLQALLGELAVVATRLELKTLTVDAVAELVADSDIDPMELYALTGGNPFFVAQMLADPGSSLPRTVEDAVLARTRPLPVSAWDVLDLVAISPEGVPLMLLPEIGPQAETDADAATRLGLLTIEGARLRARHELIRRAFEAALAPTRRRRMHARMLALLEARSQTAVDIAVLAHHAIGAGDPTNTVRYCLEAARRASLDGAHREAAAQYASALEHQAMMDASVRSDALERHAYERYLIGDIETAASAMEVAVSAARSPTDLGRCLRFQSRLGWFRGARHDALRAGRRAVEVLEADGQDLHELAYAYSNLAQLAMLDSNDAEARRWGERAIEIARREHDVEVLAHALNNVGTAATDHDTRTKLLEESLAIALEHGFEEHAARAYTNLAYHAVRDGDLERAESLLHDGLSYTEARDLETWWLYMLGTRSEFHLLSGRWEDARRDTEHVLALAEGPLIRSQASGVAARLAVRCGADNASAVVARVLDEALAISEHVRIIDACSLALEWEWHTGEPVWSPVQIEEVLDGAQSRSDATGLAIVEFWRRLLDPTVDPAPAVSDECVYEAAVLAVYDHDPDVRRRGTATLLELGADATVRALRRRLPERGIQEVPRGPNRLTRSNPAGLTPRQLEVLRLLAEGASNAAIAEQLVLAPKTVEHHVSAILGKLGATSRGEAVAVARRQGLC